jgi:hypothetical protein
MAGKETPTIKVFPEEITIENFKSIAPNPKTKTWR